MGRAPESPGRRWPGLLFVVALAGTPTAAQTLTVPAVPYLPQSEALCGGATLAMVLRYWGAPDVRPEDFAGSLTPEGTGIPADALRRLAETRGFQAFAFSGGRAEAVSHLERGRPLIASPLHCAGAPSLRGGAGLGQRARPGPRPGRRPLSGHSRGRVAEALEFGGTLGICSCSHRVRVRRPRRPFAGQERRQTPSPAPRRSAPLDLGHLAEPTRPTAGAHAHPGSRPSGNERSGSRSASRTPRPFSRTLPILPERGRRGNRSASGAEFSRVSYRPLSGGRAQLDVNVVERPAFSSPLSILLQSTVLAVSERAIGVDVFGLAPSGDSARLFGRWQPNRSRGVLAASSPRFLGLPGIVTAEAMWDEQSYRVPPTPLEGAPVRERRKRASLSLAHWWAADTRAAVALAGDDWGSLGRFVSMSGRRRPATARGSCRGGRERRGLVVRSCPLRSMRRPPAGPSAPARRPSARGYAWTPRTRSRARGPRSGSGRAPARARVGRSRCCGRTLSCARV